MRHVQGLSLVVFSILLSLLCAELILRLTSHKREFRVGTTKTHKAGLYGWAMVPNSIRVFVNPDTGEKETFVLNSQGWKDVEHSFDKPEGIVRILFLGDSYTFGLVPLQDLYTRLVERKLKERGITHVEVISIGIGSWGTDQELEALRQEGIRYKPDIVVYQFCENDLGDNMLPRKDMKVSDINKIFLEKPFRYEIRNGVLTKLEPPPRPSFAERQTPFSRQFKGFLLRSALIYRLNLLRLQILSRLQAVGSREESDGSAAEEDHSPSEDKPWWLRHPIVPHGGYKPDNGTPHREKEWEIMEALLVEMRSVSTRNGAKFVVFSESGDEGRRRWNIEWGRIETDGMQDYVVWRGKRCPVDTLRPSRDLAKLCKRHDIPFISPKRIYERYHNNPHTNAHGNEMMAEDILDFLLEWPHFQQIAGTKSEPDRQERHSEQQTQPDKGFDGRIGQLKISVVDLHPRS